jgi:hypothetical protein
LKALPPALTDQPFEGRLMAEPILVKRCPTCKTVKPASEFPRNRRNAGGLHCYCIPCNRVHCRAQRERDREKRNRQQLDHYYANWEELKAYRRQRSRAEKQAAINAYGGKCACCGEAQVEFLAIDHIDGNGREHRKALGIPASGKAFYAWLRRHGYPQANLRVLCHNCNMSLGMYGYCPHGGVPPVSVRTGRNKTPRGRNRHLNT